MLSILTIAQSYLKDDWKLTHLIYLDPEWQVNICDGEYVVVATGDNPEFALVNAMAKALDEDFAGRLFELGMMTYEARPDATSLLGLLGLDKPKTNYVRRR